MRVCVRVEMVRLPVEVLLDARGRPNPPHPTEFYDQPKVRLELA